MSDKPSSAPREALPKEEAPDLSVSFAGLRLKNPVIAASGTFGYGHEYAGLVDASSLGGIATKGLTLEARPGNKGERLHETPSGLINSIGLENPGIPAFIERELPGLKHLGTIVFANLSGGSLESYAEGASLLDGAVGVDAIELNVSCPNVKHGGMNFGLDPAVAAEVVRLVRARTGKPLVVKLSPNAPDLVGVARACEEEGADALSLVNTFKAMAIDIERGRPVFDNVSAGLSGPAIRPIALRMVWEVVGAVGVPVIGMGGIATARDALEFLMAGAVAVEVGTATFADPGTMRDIISGIADFLRERGYGGIRDVVGLARPR
ncbi:MAG TPA: dihydroorotate dehydrogenase [Rectinemataceae bacterium]|nr:dihydroorotate dehydrogenase [Rectinemataceae bacterium]